MSNHLDNWEVEFGEKYYAHTQTLPLIVCGTDPQTDLKALQSYHFHKIIWFYYPLQKFTPEYLLLTMDRARKQRCRMNLSTAMQLSDTIGINPFEVDIPEMWILSMEKP